MIFRVRVSAGFVERYLVTGKIIPRTMVEEGLPMGARLFMVHAGESGEWVYLFEGKPEVGEDTEGAIEERKIMFRTIEG